MVFLEELEVEVLHLVVAVVVDLVGIGKPADGFERGLKVCGYRSS